MSSARLRSDFWVAAHLRRCVVEGAEGVLRRRGAAEAGAIFVSVDRLDGTASLYGPAAQSLVSEDAPDRRFTAILRDAAALEIEERMRREAKFDSDLWWIEIADRNGRSFLDVTCDRTDPAG